MDNAVALVQAYLNVNGYFTVAEYPVLESLKHGGYRSITDLDILAFRFPGAGRPFSAKRGNQPTRLDRERYEPDSALRVSGKQTDMLIGEVKEGSAELNKGATDPITLKVALARFGCCASSEADEVARALLKRGHVTLSSGHELRLVVFGADTPEVQPYLKPYLVISLGHVLRFLQDYIREHWEIVRQAQLKDPIFGFLVTLEKAMQGRGIS